MSNPQSDPTGARPDELAYALITPYSLHKSRTGGILARLLWADVHLVAARMFAPRPGGEFVRRFCDAMYDPSEADVPLLWQKMLIEYVVRNFCYPSERGISNRLMLLLFRGPNAVEEISEAVGPLTQQVRGDDVRGTYGEFVQLGRDAVDSGEAQQRRNQILARYPALQRIELPEMRNEFFEPAVLTGRTRRLTDEHLRLFKDACYSDGGDVAWSLANAERDDIETSVVILKPENFRRRDPLPGNLIDFFARTGMTLTGCRMLNMDRKRAEAFYGAKLEQFRRVLTDMIADGAAQLVYRAKALVESHEKAVGQPLPADDRARIAFEMLKRCEDLYGEDHVPGPSELKPEVIAKLWPLLPEYFPDLEAAPEALKRLADELRDINARVEFEELVKYMTGGACMALLYTGPGALDNIRARLKELRKVYGQNILQNRAHASDPDEDPVGERRTLGFPVGETPEERPCDVERIIDSFLQ